ncbi:MAG: hypothetical protein AB1824_09675, partial [Acidobacteriota bacterium]
GGGGGGGGGGPHIAPLGLGGSGAGHGWGPGGPPAYGKGSGNVGQVGRVGASSSVDHLYARASLQAQASPSHFTGLQAEWLGRPSDGFRFLTYSTGAASGRSELLDDTFGFSGETATAYWNGFWSGGWRSCLRFSYERRTYRDRPVLDPSTYRPTGEDRRDRIRWLDLSLEKTFSPRFGGRPSSLVLEFFAGGFSRSTNDPYYDGDGVSAGVAVRLDW